MNVNLRLPSASSGQCGTKKDRTMDIPAKVSRKSQRVREKEVRFTVSGTANEQIWIQVGLYLENSR
jgi:hypothetical protein